MRYFCGGCAHESKKHNLKDRVCTECAKKSKTCPAMTPKEGS